MRRLTLAAAGAALLLAAPAAWAGDSAVAMGGPMGGEGPPPSARPGQCFAKVATPEVYETYPERVLDQPERIERRLLPAEYEWRDRTVVTRPASVEHYTVPPTYRTVTETVVVRPPSTRLEFVPAVYEPVTRRVLVREARTVWKPGHATLGYGPSPYGYPGDWRGQTQVTPTGEVMCLVVEPAEYRDVTEQVLRSPEHTIAIPVPGETRLQTRQVVDRPAYEASREIPAEYGHVREKVVVRPEHEETYTVPATFRSVERRRLVSPSRTEWREAPCEHPAPPPPCASACAPPPPPPPPRAPAVCGDVCARPPMRRPHRVYAPRPRPPVERRHRRYAPEPCNVCAAPPAYAPPVRARAEASAPARPMVVRLQQALATRGFYKGPIDGLYTAPTRDALTAYQRQNHFAPGQLTLETARGLGLRD